MDFHNSFQNSKGNKIHYTYCFSENTKECQNIPSTNQANLSYNNFLNNSSPTFFPSTTDNNNNQISSNMRISNIESRINTMEKMIKFFDEFVHIKSEEKLNNLNSLESELSCIGELVQKINNQEEEIKNLKNQMANNEIENSKKLKVLQNKISNLEQIIFKNGNNEKLVEKIEYQNNFDTKNLDDVIDKKSKEIYNNDKIKEILTIINDINKITEDNEFNINEQNEVIRKIQNDNLTLIKVLSTHSEKINNVDFILNEINDLKDKYQHIMSILNNNEKDEQIFTNQFISKYKLDNKNSKNNK